MLLTLVSFAFVITVLVFIHELGHYLAARSTGMRVEKFSVGFENRLEGFFPLKYMLGLLKKKTLSVNSS